MPNGQEISHRWVCKLKPETSKSKSYSLGHGSLLQKSICTSLPSHCLPPCCGAGLAHSRVLCLVPPPQETLQAPQLTQDDHFPSTGRQQKKEEEESEDQSPDFRKKNFIHWVTTDIYQKIRSLSPHQDKVSPCTLVFGCLCPHNAARQTQEEGCCTA